MEKHEAHGRRLNMGNEGKDTVLVLPPRGAPSINIQSLCILRTATPY